MSSDESIQLISACFREDLHREPSIAESSLVTKIIESALKTRFVEINVERKRDGMTWQMRAFLGDVVNIKI